MLELHKGDAVRLYMVSHHAKGDEPFFYLYRKHEGATEWHVATEAETSAKAIGEMLDQECENCNYHSMVGTHEFLATLLVNKTGSQTARDIMLVVAKAECGLAQACR